MKYHYEYELKTNNYYYGCVRIALFKTYDDACHKMRLWRRTFGAMKINKVRVYDEKK